MGVLWWVGLSKWMWGVCVLRQMWGGCVKMAVGWVYYGGCGVGLLRWMWGWYVRRMWDGCVKRWMGLLKWKQGCRGLDWTLGHLSFDRCTFRLPIMHLVAGTQIFTGHCRSFLRWLFVLPAGAVRGFHRTGHHPLHAADPPRPRLSP